MRRLPYFSDELAIGHSVLRGQKVAKISQTLQIDAHLIPQVVVIRRNVDLDPDADIDNSCPSQSVKMCRKAERRIQWYSHKPLALSNQMAAIKAPRCQRDTPSKSDTQLHRPVRLKSSACLVSIGIMMSPHISLSYFYYPPLPALLSAQYNGKYLQSLETQFQSAKGVIMSVCHSYNTAIC